MNFQELAENLGLEEDEYLELLQLFIDTSGSDMIRLQSAIEVKNGEKAVVAAHSLKGAAANLGLMEIHEQAKKMEADARDNRFDDVAEAVPTLKNKLEVIANLIAS
jgi:HPt (histidine-containing phosphotransfer) domain-containing protein